MIQSGYLVAFSLATFLWCGSFLAFTWLIDPYGVSPVTVSWKRVNQFKPKRLDIDRLIKPYEVWRYKPRTVFLGTSRTHQSIDPSYLDGTMYAPAYNASIPASSLGLNISHLRQYVELDPRLRVVVVELFLYNFLGQSQEHASKSFAEYLRNTAGLFLSTDALWATVQTFFYNAVEDAPVYEIKPGGFFSYPPGHDASGPFNGFATGIWKLHQTRSSGMTLYQPAFDALRELIKVSREHNLNLVLVLTPNHAYDDYYLDSIGVWSTVEEWLRRVSAEATVYSFSQPNDWVYEPVRTGMRYWNDPYHFSLEMGRAMQLELAGKPDPNAPKNFMIRMSPDKVREHVHSRRDAIRRWALKNPEFVRKFEKERRNWELGRASRTRR